MPLERVFVPMPCVFCLVDWYHITHGGVIRFAGLQACQVLRSQHGDHGRALAAVPSPATSISLGTKPRALFAPQYVPDEFAVETVLPI